MTNEKKNQRQLVRDPVCGMWIEPKDAADIEIYKGIIFYFCAPGCKKVFLEDPEKFFSKKQMKDSASEQ